MATSAPSPAPVDPAPSPPPDPTPAPTEKLPIQYPDPATGDPNRPK